jgi:hypothetical protein
MKILSARPRGRQHLRKLRGNERRELISPTPRYGYTEARVRWLNEALHRAIKIGDHTEVERLTPICLEARKEFEALLAFKDTENKRVNDRARSRLLVGVR